MIGKPAPCISIGEFSSVVHCHQQFHKTIHEIYAVYNGKHSIDEIERFLTHNAVSAKQLLEHCKTTGRLPDGR